MESPARSAYRKADASFKAGDYRSALGLFDEAVRLAREEKKRDLLARAMLCKGSMHRALGQVKAVFSFSPFLSFSFLARVSTMRLWPAFARQSL